MATHKSQNPEADVAIEIPNSTNEQSPKMGVQNISVFDIKPVNISCPSPDISKSSPGQSPKTPRLHPPPESTLLRRRTFRRSSRFGDSPLPIDAQTIENLTNFPEKLVHQSSFTPKTPRGNVPGRLGKEKEKESEGPDEKEIYQKITAQLTAQNRKRITVKYVLQLFVFLVFLGLLLFSLLDKRFEGENFLGAEVWRWFALVLVVFSGMLVTQWVVHMIVFLIEWKFMLKKNVVYFTHGLQDNFVVFIWIGVVLATWASLFGHKVRKSENSKNVLHFITRTLVSLLISSFVWLLKTTLVKILASSFHLNRFFDRIHEAVFYHYVLQTLSGRPLIELARKISKEESCVGQVSFTELEGSHKGKKVVDWRKLQQMKREKVPSWTMKLLVDVVSNSGLSTVSGIFSENLAEGGVALDDNEISNEEAAIACAVRIFYNVVGDKTEPYIDKNDLLRFMIWEEVDLVYPWFEVNEKGQVDLKVFCKWVVRIYNDRQTLKHGLNDNKTAVDDLNKILIGIIIVISFILWLLLTEIATTKLIVFISSQLVVAAFIFGNTCKTIFEAIIFVFVMHPFDVGDHCIIDGTLLMVEEMNILSTVFLKIDKEKVYYPNAVLTTKTIGNFYRSPDQGDLLEFSIDYRTPLLKIEELKERIRQYLEQNPHLWHSNHTFFVKEIESINKINMALIFNHTMNFQDWPQKLKRRSELVLEMKNIFDSLEITYNLLPQEVLLSNVPANSILGHR